MYTLSRHCPASQSMLPTRHKRDRRPNVGTHPRLSAALKCMGWGSKENHPGSAKSIGSRLQPQALPQGTKTMIVNGKAIARKSRKNNSMCICHAIATFDDRTQDHGVNTKNKKESSSLQKHTLSNATGRVVTWLV
jgi:hypothetical protein